MILPKKETPVSRCVVPLLMLLIAPLTLPACSNESSSERGEVATYSSRGEIVEIEAGSVVIHHETIADFVTSDGQVMPMAAHAMGFTPAQGVSLNNISVGDKVEFAFDVWWQPLPGFELSRITKLPPDTELDIQTGGPKAHDHAEHDH